MNGIIILDNVIDDQVSLKYITHNFKKVTQPRIRGKMKNNLHLKMQKNFSQ